MSRDRAVDALRAYAIGGVVLGHWLVTGLVLAGDGGLHQASPLTALPDLAPVTWVLQTLGLFFFTAGFGSTRSLARYPGGAGGWLAGRLRRLLLPTVALLGVGAAVLLAATVVGTSDDTLAVALRLAVSPLWFLLPLVVLVALTGPLRVAVRRWGWRGAGRRRWSWWPLSTWPSGCCRPAPTCPRSPYWRPGRCRTCWVWRTPTGGWTAGGRAARWRPVGRSRWRRCWRWATR